MKLKKITWEILPDVGNPCQLCHKWETVYHATIEINPSGSLTLSLCNDCTKLHDKTILEEVFYA